MIFDNNTLTFKDKGRFGTISLAVGLVALALTFLGFFADRSQFLFSWLTAFTFWVSVGFGGLFFVMLHHLVGALWSVPIRRLAESVMVTLPWMAIFAIPIFLGMSEIYEWVDINRETAKGHTTVQTEQLVTGEKSTQNGVHGAKTAVVSTPGSEIDEEEALAHQAEVKLIESKKGYLNVPFFIFRTLFYFAVWGLLALLLWRISIRQDRQGFAPEQVSKFRKISAPGIIAFAFTVTFAGFDWLMSLFPAWYSTIYGLYYFAGGIMAVMAFLAVATIRLQKAGALTDVITEEHYHDIGKLLFAFMIVWAYFAFSQYLLIWYANLPEETVYYKERWVGSWKAVSVILPLGHFVIPFVALMSRHAKRNVSALLFFSVWLLVMHWLDLYWNVMPVLKPLSAMPSWLDLTSMVGIGGIFLFIFWNNFTRHAAVAINDPKLEEAVRFENI